MYSEWYRSLKKGLGEIGLLYREETEYRTALQDYAGMLQGEDWLASLPPELRKRYDLCVSLNCMKFSLAAESFRKTLRRDAVAAGTAFILAGCIADSLLDECSPLQREIAFRKLDWAYCGHYFERLGTLLEPHPLDQLYEVVGKFLKAGKLTSPAYYEDILSLLRRAAQAECLIGARKKSKSAVMDKSVLFVVIGFQLAFYGEYSALEREIFFRIGDIFRLVDDLCDLEEDERSGQPNSLLLTSPGESPSVLAEAAVSELQQKLLQLQELISRDFYHFLRHEIRVWTLGCPQIYKNG